MPHPIRATWHTRPGWSEFGAWRSHGGHNGFDYYCPEGTPIYGTQANGVVHSIGYNMNVANGFGHSVTVNYPGGVQTIDAHMQSRTPLNVGDAVGTDTLLGYVGKTGNAVNTIWQGMRHDHHEVRINGQRVDPISYYMALAGAESDPLVNSKDTEMAWMKSTATGHWYLVGEFTHEKFTEFEPASQVSQSLGQYSVAVDSPVILAAMARADVARAALVKDIADTVLAGIADGVTVTAAVDEHAIAAAVEAQLADEFAAVSQAIDDVPGETLDELRGRLA